MFFKPQSKAEFSLPYFDEFLSKFQAGDLETQRIWGSNVHFGYWDKPEFAQNTASDFIAASRRMNEVLFEKASMRDGLKVLDVGCGFGGTIKQLDRQYSNLTLVGLNIDERQLGRARTKVLPGARNPISFVQGDACRLPFDKNTFDVLFAVECIFHFQSRWQFLQEAKRVLKPGGRLVVSDFIYFAPTLYLMNHWISKQKEFQKWGRLNPASEARYRTLSKLVGLKDLKFEDMTPNTIPNYQIFFAQKDTSQKAEKIFRFLTDHKIVKYMTISATS